MVHPVPLLQSLHYGFDGREFLLISVCSLLPKIAEVSAEKDVSVALLGSTTTRQSDSAEKGLSMLRRAQHERKMVNVINHLSVRPELVEG